MKFTLIVIQLDKSVVRYEFENKHSMFDFKNYHCKAIKDVEINQIDRDGYVWCCELSAEE